MQPRFRQAVIPILALFILLTFTGLHSLAQTKDIANDGKGGPTPVAVSNDDLIALNGNITAQAEAGMRRDKAMRELQAAMNDFDKAGEAIQAFAATLPKGAEPVRNAKGMIVKFQIPAPVKP